MKQPVYKPVYFYPRDPKNQWSHNQITVAATRSVYNGSSRNSVEQGIPLDNKPSEYILQFMASSHSYRVAVVKVLDSIHRELLEMTIYLDSSVFDKALLEGNVEAGHGATVIKGTYVFKQKGQLKLCTP